mmetsp:Transcript_29112/g.70303  ORF Transcript_29112/g.70303 Transcript_29112/m.70303 type:complete len:412 (-) Transcript_29112:287-1522(-)
MNAREGVEYLHLAVFVICSIGVNVSKDSWHTSTKRVIQEHLLHSTIEKRIDSGSLHTGGEFVDQCTSTVSLFANETRRCDDFRQFWNLGNVIASTVDGGNSHVFAGLECHLSHSCKRGTSFGISILRIVYDISDTGCHQTVWIFKGGRLTKNLVDVKYNGKQRGSFIERFDERKTVVSMLLNLHFGLICWLCGHFEKRHGQGTFLGLIDSHPTFQSTSHLFQAPVKFSTTGFNLGQTIQDFQLNSIRSSVCEGSSTNQRSKIFFGQDEIFDVGGQTVNSINLLDFDFVGTDVQDTFGLIAIVFIVQEIARIRWSKWFHIKGSGKSSSASSTDKCSEANVWCYLVRLVRGIELENGKIFGGGSKGRNGLSTIDVESPDRLTKVSSDTWEEGGESGSSIEVFHKEAAMFIKQL